MQMSISFILSHNLAQTYTQTQTIKNMLMNLQAISLIEQHVYMR